MEQKVLIYSIMLGFQLISPISGQTSGPAPIVDVIDSGADIERCGWEEEGATYVEDIDGLPDWMPGEMSGLPGKGLWYWKKDWDVPSNSEVKFNTALDTYKDAESVILTFDYYLFIPAFSSSKLELQPVKCSEENCSPIYVVPRSTEVGVWSTQTVEIDVQALPINFKATFNSGNDWLVFDKIEVQFIQNPPTTTVEPSTTTEEPSTTTIEPSTTTDEPSTTTVEPSTATDEPSTSTILPSTSTVEPSTTTVEPSTSTVEPSTSTVEPSTTTVEPSTSTVEPSTTTVEPSTSSVKPSTSTVKPSTSTVEPSITTTVEPSTTNIQPSTTTIAQSSNTESAPTTIEGKSTTVTEPETTEPEPCMPETENFYEDIWFIAFCISTGLLILQTAIFCYIYSKRVHHDEQRHRQSQKSVGLNSRLNSILIQSEIAPNPDPTSRAENLETTTGNGALGVPIALPHSSKKVFEVILPPENSDTDNLYIPRAKLSRASISSRCS